MSGHCNDCGGNPCLCSEMRSAGIEIKRGANKSKRQRDNWKRRYEELVAMLRDDKFADQFPFVGHSRARLLAKIDEGSEQMPSQLFRITRAPEAEPIDSETLRRFLWATRKDSEWEVTDMDALSAALAKAKKREGAERNES